MLHKKRVLIAVTSHDELGTTGRPTGYYLSEVSHPYLALTERGYTVDFVSPRGGRAPMDPGSRTGLDPASQRFLETPALMARLDRTLRAADVDPSAYAAILFAGGHGTMWDFAEDPGLLRLSRAIYERGGVIGAVCHGPAALVNLTLSDGTPLVRGRRVTAFSAEEERAVRLEGVVPFPLAATLAARGAIYEHAATWAPHVVTDGRLITGQNPASAEGVGRAVAEALNALAASAPEVTVTMQLSARVAADLRAHLLEVIPVTRRADGCRYSRTYQSRTDPRQFLLVQGWDSAEKQRAYLAWREQRGDLAVFRRFLDGDPIVETYERVDE